MKSYTALETRYRKRKSRHGRDRLLRLLEPPAPFIMNPAEPKDFPLGRWNLDIGGAGRLVDGCVNMDLLAAPAPGERYPTEFLADCSLY